MTVEVKDFRAGLIGEFWDDFRERVIPADAPDFQIDAMNSAYLAGACAYSVAMTAVLKSANGEKKKLSELWDLLDDEMAEKLDSISAEPIGVANAANVTITIDGKTIATQDGEGKTRVSVLDVRGLSDSDVTELGSLIEQFIGERKAGLKVTD